MLPEIAPHRISTTSRTARRTGRLETHLLPQNSPALYFFKSRYLTWPPRRGGGWPNLWGTLTTDRWAWFIRAKLELNTKSPPRPTAGSAPRTSGHHFRTARSCRKRGALTALRSFHADTGPVGSVRFSRARELEYGVPYRALGLCRRHDCLLCPS
jgi:hypothetical protein